MHAYVCVCVCVGQSKTSGGGGAGSSSGAPLPKKPKLMPTTSSASSSGGASKALFADPVRLSQTGAAQKSASNEGRPPVESEWRLSTSELSCRPLLLCNPLTHSSLTCGLLCAMRSASLHLRHLVSCMLAKCQ